MPTHHIKPEMERFYAIAVDAFHLMQKSVASRA
jgi:hypothetical protein